MNLTESISVRVNEELVLDAGTWEVVSTPQGKERLIRPPSTSLFHQVLNYLKSKPDPPKSFTVGSDARVGEVTAALVLRWGSYLSVLFDNNKPMWSVAGSEGTSRISDEEMARINIEASAALADWIQLCRKGRCQGTYAKLLRKAAAYLPLPTATPKVTFDGFTRYVDLPTANQVIDAARDRVDTILPTVKDYPNRVFANSLIHTAWRNGPIEAVHCGEPVWLPLDRRRVTEKEEQVIMGAVSARLGLGMAAWRQLVTEIPSRWPVEQVLPFVLVRTVTPTRWSLTEESREVRLWGE